MNSKPIVLLIIGIVIGGAIGITVNYSIFASQLNTLQINLKDAEARYTKLSNEKNEIQKSYDDTRNKYNALQTSKDILQSKYDQLENENKQNIGYLKQISKNIVELKDTLRSYTGVTEAFSRTLNDAEIKKTSNIVTTLATKNTDSWTARDNIYNYITSNINYCYDTEYPYISNWRYITLDDSQIWTEFNIDTTQNFIQTPEFTLTNKQGDCDDQTFLEYAMIMYYYRYLSGTTYKTYIAAIEFTSGPGHLAVFVPVEGGKLCILDTSGHYKTNSRGSTTSKLASSELDAYNSLWMKDGHPPISKITLYSVDTTNGSYTNIAEGPMPTIVEFLSK
jgi:hypothetical protein